MTTPKGVHHVSDRCPDCGQRVRVTASGDVSLHYPPEVRQRDKRADRLCLRLNLAILPTLTLF
jgi:hypothetical protein